MQDLSAQQLREMISSLVETVTANQELIARNQTEITHKQALIDKLTHENAILKRLKFAASCERFSAEQRSLLEEMLDEDLQAVSDEIDKLSTGDAPPPKAKERPKRQPLPANLPRTDIHHEPDLYQHGHDFARTPQGIELAQFPMDNTASWPCQDSHDRDDPGLSDTRPGQTHDQGVELFMADVLHRSTRTGPDKLALVQSACGQPDAQPIVHQYLQTVTAFVGKEVGRMRVGGTKHGHDPGQSGVGSGAHVHGGDGQPHGIDADHLRTDWVHCAKSATALTGQVTVIDRAPLRSSTLSSGPLGRCLTTGSCIGMKAGADAFAITVSGSFAPSS
ncbi:MAG: transposase [Pseudomonadota bacterium]